MCTGINGARGSLLASNLVLMLVALACIASSAILIIGKSIYGPDLEFLRQNLRESASKIRGDNSLDVSELDVIFVTLPLGVVLLLFGVLITTVTILGIIAACGRFYKFVIVYMVLLSCLLFIHIVIIICVYIDRKPFDSTIRRLLKATLQTFTDINGQDSLTLGWNAIMSYKNCCGVDGYEDFAIAGYPTMVKSGVNSYTAVTPQICCIDKDGSGDCVDINNFKQKTYYSYGCYDHIWDYVTSQTGLVIVAVFFITLVEYLCLFFSLWVVCSRRRVGINKVGSIHDQN